MPDDYETVKEGLEAYLKAGTAIMLLLVVLFVIFIIISIQKRRGLIRDKQLLEEKIQQELLQTQLEVQEQTLKTVSQEIHDNLGQTLSLAKLNLALAEIETSNPKITQSHDLVSKAIQDLRNLSKSLNTDYIKELGLLKAIQYELDLINRTGVCYAELKLFGYPKEVNSQKELILFRIVQESLNNIIKHANAKNISIKLEYQEFKLRLLIEDDGQGFDFASVAEAGNPFAGIGIKNMQNRSSLIGADFRIISGLQQGTIISIELSYT